MIRALVFDLDDTLFPEREFVTSGFEAVDAWLRQSKSITGFLEAGIAAFNAGTRGTIFNAVLNRLGVSDKEELILQMVEVYRNHVPKIHLFEDAASALGHYAGRKQLALLTDGYLRVQQRKVVALGIAHRFSAMVFSDEGGRGAWKPSPAPYRRLMNSLQRPGDECVYVGDNPAKDFVTAKALGWHTVRVVREAGEYSLSLSPESHQADVTIHSLEELQNSIPD